MTMKKTEEAPALDALVDQMTLPSPIRGISRSRPRLSDNLDIRLFDEDSAAFLRLAYTLFFEAQGDDPALTRAWTRLLGAVRDEVAYRENGAAD